MPQDSSVESAKIDRDLAQRLRRALSAGSEDLYQVLLDPSAEVLRTALKNRNLSEDHLLALLKRRDLSEDLTRAISQMESAKKSHRLQLALVHNIATPGPLVLSLLPNLHLFELLDLCILPGVTPDQRYAAERQITQRLPTTELGSKLTLARRGTGSLIGHLLKEGEPALVQVCLDSSRLREVDVAQFIGSSRARAETLSMIARHPRWKNRPNLRMNLLRNPKTPGVWFTVFLPQLKSSEINTLLASRRLTPKQKKLVHEELRRRNG